MPTYDYACERCGPFAAWRPLALFDQPAPCPACDAASMRALTVPALSGRRRSAAAHDEDPSYRRLTHGAACACCPS